MLNIGKEIKAYLEEYRAADSAMRKGKREISIFEYHKWELIREGIKKIELEEAD